jgi:protein TonB
MIRTVPKPRRFRRPLPTGSGDIRLNLPTPTVFRKVNLLLCLAALFVLAVVLHFGGRALSKQVPEEEQVRVVEAEPPPLPSTVVVEPPKPPPPPPPDPDQPPPPKDAPPPQAVFGMPEEAAKDQGGVEVATGNTLMKPADSLVQKAPPPLPSAPVELDKQPAALNQVVPEYPSWAEEQGIQAQVRLTVTIDPLGKVTNVIILASGGKDFDVNAKKAAEATRFQPLVQGGQARPARFNITYDFSL